MRKWAKHRRQNWEHGSHERTDSVDHHLQQKKSLSPHDQHEMRDSGLASHVQSGIRVSELERAGESNRVETPQKEEDYYGPGYEHTVGEEENQSRPTSGETSLSYRGSSASEVDDKEIQTLASAVAAVVIASRSVGSRPSGKLGSHRTNHSSSAGYDFGESDSGGSSEDHSLIAPVLSSLAMAVLREITATDPEIANCLSSDSSGDPHNRQQKLQATYVIAEVLSSRLEQLGSAGRSLGPAPSRCLPWAPDASDPRGIPSAQPEQLRSQNRPRGGLPAPRRPDRADAAARHPRAPAGTEQEGALLDDATAMECAHQLIRLSYSHSPFSMLRLLHEWSIHGLKLGLLRATLRHLSRPQSAPTGRSAALRDVAEEASAVLLLLMVSHQLSSAFAAHAKAKRGPRSRSAAAVLCKLFNRALHSREFWLDQVLPGVREVFGAGALGTAESRYLPSAPRALLWRCLNGFLLRGGVRIRAAMRVKWNNLRRQSAVLGDFWLSPNDLESFDLCSFCLGRAARPAPPRPLASRPGVRVAQDGRAALALSGARAKPKRGHRRTYRRNLSGEIPDDWRRASADPVQRALQGLMASAESALGEGGLGALRSADGGRTGSLTPPCDSACSSPSPCSDSSASESGMARGAPTEERTVKGSWPAGEGPGVRTTGHCTAQGFAVEVSETAQEQLETRTFGHSLSQASLVEVPETAQDEETQVNAEMCMDTLDDDSVDEWVEEVEEGSTEVGINSLGRQPSVVSVASSDAGSVVRVQENSPSEMDNPRLLESLHEQLDESDSEEFNLNGSDSDGLSRRQKLDGSDSDGFNRRQKLDGSDSDGFNRRQKLDGSDSDGFNLDESGSDRVGQKLDGPDADTLNQTQLLGPDVIAHVASLDDEEETAQPESLDDAERLIGTGKSRVSVSREEWKDKVLSRIYGQETTDHRNNSAVFDGDASTGSYSTDEFENSEAEGPFDEVPEETRGAAQAAAEEEERGKQSSESEDAEHEHSKRMEITMQAAGSAQRLQKKKQITFAEFDMVHEIPKYEEDDKDLLFYSENDINEFWQDADDEAEEALGLVEDKLTSTAESTAILSATDSSSRSEML